MAHWTGCHRRFAIPTSRVPTGQILYRQKIPGLGPTIRRANAPPPLDLFQGRNCVRSGVEIAVRDREQNRVGIRIEIERGTGIIEARA
ncbi:hypothetical protein EVAR_5493_1 [Eumeta japonica]|uniref:Uncharacterized protein n=1 Tax=Eumeta variegata TaxID=151549 RepID=A0A4C1T9W6_EUMVA|nr:hypothetical protein EVAR_5493_1 [Eumeta japonica]